MNKKLNFFTLLINFFIIGNFQAAAQIEKKSTELPDKYVAAVEKFTKALAAGYDVEKQRESETITDEEKKNLADSYKELVKVIQELYPQIDPEKFILSLFQGSD